MIREADNLHTASYYLNNNRAFWGLMAEKHGFYCGLYEKWDKIGTRICRSDEYG